MEECPQCGNIEELHREVDKAIDENKLLSICPKCHYINEVNL